MGWHGPREGYRSVEQAIRDNFRPDEIAEVAHSGRPGGDGVGWVRGERSATDGAPWICCVLLERGLVKILGVEVHPYYYGVPAAWLDLVPSRGGEWEEEWRARVRLKSTNPREAFTGIVVPSGGVSCDD